MNSITVHAPIYGRSCDLISIQNVSFSNKVDKKQEQSPPRQPIISFLLFSTNKFWKNHFEVKSSRHVFLPNKYC